MKRGFTLIEVLAVVTVLGILVAIVTPIVSGTINEATDRAYEKQIDNLVKVAAAYAYENDSVLPDEVEGKKSVINFNDLLTSGKINQDEIINPKTERQLTGCIMATYSEEYNQYDFKYVEDNNNCIPN